MKLFSSTSELTELAELIMDENIITLEEKFSKGLDINAVFHITKHIDETPIILALCENKIKVINWLISKNVELNDKKNLALIMAASNCDIEIIQLLLNNEADINAKDHLGRSVMTTALYGEKFDTIPFLIAKGYNLKQDGVSLRQAIYAKQNKAIQVFLENNIDVNFHVRNSVFPYNSSSVLIATQNNDIETVKLLISRGADITEKDEYGERPYTAAVKNKNKELIELIKSLEPKEWHNEEQRIIELKKCKLPKPLIELLRSKNRRIDIDHSEVKYIVFDSLLNVKEVTFQGHKVLDLLSEVDNYEAGGFLVWYAKKKCIAFADYEHEEFKELCSWKEFLKNPAKQIDKILD